MTGLRNPTANTTFSRTNDGLKRTTINRNELITGAHAQNSRRTEEMHIISNARTITAKIASGRFGFMTESIKEFAATLVAKIFSLGVCTAMPAKRRGESHVIRTWVGRLVTTLKVGLGIRVVAVARQVGLLVAGAGILGGSLLVMPVGVYLLL